MPVKNPDQADVFQAGESFPFLAGKVSNQQADIFQNAETLASLMGTSLVASTLKRLLLMGVG